MPARRIRWSLIAVERVATASASPAHAQAQAQPQTQPQPQAQDWFDWQTMTRDGGGLRTDLQRDGI